MDTSQGITVTIPIDLYNHLRKMEDIVKKKPTVLIKTHGYPEGSWDVYASGIEWEMVKNEKTKEIIDSIKAEFEKYSSFHDRVKEESPKLTPIQWLKQFIFE